MSMLMPFPLSVLRARERAGAQAARRVHSPALGDRRELRVDPPAVRLLRARVLEARALQRHAAGVLTDRADRPPLLGAQRGPHAPPIAGARRRELGALLLDRARARYALLDQVRRHAAHGLVREVPGAG